MKSFLVFLFVIISVQGCAQRQLIKMQKYWSSNFSCFDSTQSRLVFCDTDRQRMQIKFFSATFDRITKEIHILGKVCLAGNEDFCDGAPVQIFKSVLSGQNLTNIIEVGEGTDSHRYEYNRGFFDIRFQLIGNESLFFYHKDFALEEYKLSVLLKRW